MTNYILNRNYQKKRKYNKPSGTIADPSYKEFAYAVTDSMGQEPGDPNQFKNIRKANNPHPQRTPESILIETNNDSFITKIFRNPLVRFNSMVEDVPFDKIGFDKTQQNLKVLGFGSLLIGAAYSLDWIGR